MFLIAKLFIRNCSHSHTRLYVWWFLLCQIDLFFTFKVSGGALRCQISNRICENVNNFYFKKCQTFWQTFSNLEVREIKTFTTPSLKLIYENVLQINMITWACTASILRNLDCTHDAIWSQINGNPRWHIVWITQEEFVEGFLICSDWKW